MEEGISPQQHVCCPTARHKTLLWELSTLAGIPFPCSQMEISLFQGFFHSRFQLAGSWDQEGAHTARGAAGGGRKVRAFLPHSSLGALSKEKNGILAEKIKDKSRAGLCRVFLLLLADHNSSLGAWAGQQGVRFIQKSTQQNSEKLLTGETGR